MPCDQTPAPGHFSCFAERTRRSGFTSRRRLAAASASAMPSGYGPADLQSAYALAQAAAGNGSDQTVYVVDAYDDPKAESDLAVYRSQYGLPALHHRQRLLPQAEPGRPGRAVAGADEGWAGEIALDLAMVSAVCPLCKITLIESDDNGESLFVAVKRATTLGAKFVSLSWGGNEDGTEPSYDRDYFNSSGVVYTAASGDDAYAAGVSYPASSPRVVAVGGTHLTHSSAARGWSESVWNNFSGGTGSGCSASEAKPAWQSVVASSTCTRRAITDVSAVADPATGVAVYFTYGTGNDGGPSSAAPAPARRSSPPPTPWPARRVPAPTRRPALRRPRRPQRRHQRLERQLPPAGAVPRRRRVGRADRARHAARHRRVHGRRRPGDQHRADQPGARTATSGRATSLPITARDSGRRH